MTRRLIRLLALLVVTTFAQASPTTAVLAQGARDGNAAAWAISVESPTGWTRDCCTYAHAIGVNAVLYRGEWTGKPQRVMVLNVWPRKLPSLAAEIQADRQRYGKLDPRGKTSNFSVQQPDMACEASIHEGSDRVDDVLVFCDPGRASGIRLGWSMSLDDNDASSQALLDAFMRVVVASRYQRVVAPAAHDR